MAASMWSSSTGVDEAFNGGGELMEALEPFMIKTASPLLPPPNPPSSLFPSETSSFYPSSFSFSSPSVSYPYGYGYDYSGFGSSAPAITTSDGCSTSDTHMFSSQGSSGFGFEQPGCIGLNQLTPTQINQIEVHMNLPAGHGMSSGPFQGQWAQQQSHQGQTGKSIDSKKSKGSTSSSPKQPKVKEEEVEEKSKAVELGSDSSGSGGASGESSPVSDLTFPEFTGEDSTWDMCSDLHKFPSYEIDWESLSHLP
nr:ethylene-responsive transcription factor RAP2-13-like [Ipomoea trifida]